MTSEKNNLQWTVFPSAEEVAGAAAEHILRLAHQAIAERGLFRLALAGGRTPMRTYQMLATEQQDWNRWRLYYGDERCLPVDHPDRNSVMARRAWLDACGLADDRHFPIPAELGAEAGASAYRQTLEAQPRLDLVLLGMGEDGHTASLFPAHQHPPEALVVAVHDAPKPPPDRISLGLGALRAAGQRLVLITGPGKREALLRWRRGDDLPVAAATLPGAWIYLDEDAEPNKNQDTTQT